MSDFSFEYTIFHTSQSGRPDSYDSVGFTFEPKNWEGGEQFAPVYLTRAEAQAACDSWVFSQVEFEGDLNA